MTLDVLLREALRDRLLDGPPGKQARGENTFAEADYAASWGRHKVTAAEWHALRDELARD